MWEVRAEDDVSAKRKQSRTNAVRGKSDVSGKQYMHVGEKEGCWYVSAL